MLGSCLFLPLKVNLKMSITSNHMSLCKCLYATLVHTLFLQGGKSTDLIGYPISLLNIYSFKRIHESDLRDHKNSL